MAELTSKEKANANAKRRASCGEPNDTSPKGDDLAIGTPTSSIAKNKAKTAREEKDIRRISPKGQLLRSKDAAALKACGIGTSRDDQAEIARRKSSPEGKTSDDAAVHLDEDDDEVA